MLGEGGGVSHLSKNISTWAVSQILKTPGLNKFLSSVSKKKKKKKKIIYLFSIKEII